MPNAEREEVAAVKAPGAVPRYSPAAIAAAVGNAGFAAAATPGSVAPEALRALIAGGGAASSGALARSTAGLWGDTRVPGSDPALAARLEGMVLARAPAARAPGRCACGGTPDAGGECAACRQKRLAGEPAALARKDGDGKDEISADDERLKDPGFLICTAFCFLGIPPSFFKDIVSAMLEAAYKQLEAEDPSTAREKFRVHHQALSAYGKLKMLGLAFRFLMAGELWFGLPVRAAAATAVREAVLKRLVAAGLKEASLIGAEAIVRRALLYINLAIAANCAAYCGLDQCVKAAIETSEAASRGLTEGLAVLQGVGTGVSGAVSAVLANAYGQLDPANWTVVGLKGQASGDVQALGSSLFAQVRPGSPWRGKAPAQSEADAFVANAARPISSFTTSYVQDTLLPSIATASQSALGQSGAKLTGPMLAAMSPLGLVTFLRDNGLIAFGQDPIAYANAQLAAAAAPAPAAP